MNFKIGQKVVAIKDHTSGVFKKGDVFTVKNILPSFCKCKQVLIDIGKSGCTVNWCRACNIDSSPNNTMLFKETNFAPIITNTSTADIANQIFETCNDVKEIKIPELG